MTAVNTKRKRPFKWVLVLYRPVGEFDKNGERRMSTYWNTRPVVYKNEKRARRAMCANWRAPIVALVHRKGRKPKRIIELQVFDEDYTGE